MMDATKTRFTLWVLLFAATLCFSAAVICTDVQQAFAASKPGKATITKVTSSSSASLTVKIKKVRSAKGYQIQVSTSKKFTTKTTKKLLTSKLTATFKNLKQNTTYYVRARAYKASKKKRTYGRWSAIKTIAIKKAAPAATPASTPITVPNTTFTGLTFKQITPTNEPATFTPLIFQNKLMQQYGSTGAGSQWPVSLESSATGNLMLYGTDVAGMFKSTDHGKTWERANSGFDSRGVNMFAIDPRNEQHVLALGLGVNRTVGGIYQSNDGAQTWNQTFAIATEGARYLWDGLEFDPTSYNASQKICTDVYFSVPYDRDCERRNKPSSKPDKVNNLTESQAGIYRSTDGGTTFTLYINDRKLADGIVRITSDGRVFVGNQHGLFFLKEDGAYEEITQFANDGDTEYAKGVTGLDVVGNTLYVQTWDGIFTVVGDTVTKISTSTYKSTQWPQFFCVSKTNTNHMMYTYRTDVNNYYVSKTLVTTDGGSTWQDANFATNSNFYKAGWNGREKTFVIDPSNDARVVTFGSDCVVYSDDGGKNFVQASGISNMMIGGRVNFNVYSPETYLLAAQDYSGAYTHDGGMTFDAVEGTGKGNMYGGFAADDYTFVGFAGPKWNTGSLTVSHDGGGTWHDTGLESTKNASFSAMQSPSNPDVLFAANYCSKDRGYTWNPMKNCITVHTYNYTGAHELYGENASGNVVVSYDNGDTWVEVTTSKLSGRPNKPDEQIIDMAFDQVNRYLYVLLGLSSGGNTDQCLVRLDLNTLKSTPLTVPLDRTRGWAALKAVAVDPNSTSVVYACMSGGYFSAATSLVRSVDGGQTWSVLTTSNKPEYPSNATNQGGYEVSELEVDPYTGNVLASGGCYGAWMVSPPYDQKLISHAKPAVHTIKYVYDGKVVHTSTVKNNDKHRYQLNVSGVQLIDWYLDPNFKTPFPNGSFVYKSMVLYAKVKSSAKVTFVSEGKTCMTLDVDKYDAGNAKYIPKRDGYAFAGWFGDKSLTKPLTSADIKNASQSITAYAGWYRILEDAFDPTAQDTYNYLDYSTHKVQDMALVSNDAYANNRSLLLKVKKDSFYCISLRMQTRFRIGMRTTTIWPQNAVTTYYCDPRDVNGTTPVNEYVIKVIATESNINMMINYYNYRCNVPFQEVRNTVSIYRIESDTPVL